MQEPGLQLLFIYIYLLFSSPRTCSQRDLMERNDPLQFAQGELLFSRGVVPS